MKPETSRRALLGALAALPAVATLAKAETVTLGLSGGPKDRIPALYAEKLRAIGVMNGGGLSDEEINDLTDIWMECEAQAIATPATTVAGAAASISWARDELEQFGFDEHHNPSDKGATLILALMDGALAALHGGSAHA